jgi:hypothetical protein
MGDNNLNYMKLQNEYDTIYSFFKNTQPAFDELDWDGEELKVIYKNEVIETYLIECEVLN